jgi:protocatechuate 3,4-dioxygenase alpha subunit
MHMPALTPSQTIGPFFAEAFRWAIEMSTLQGGVRVSGRVLDRDGVGVSDAVLEIWQPDWAAQQPLGGLQRVATDDEGRFTFAMPKPDKGQVHANVTVFARGLLNGLFTRIYLHPAGDPAAVDLSSGVPPARRATLIAKRTGPEAYAWDVRLQGEGETVFFEI